MKWINSLLKITGKTHLLLLYRTLSLLLTSAVFLMKTPVPSPIFKIGVVCSLVIAAWILTDLQRKHHHNTQALIFIVLIETLGNVLLLIPTGGIASPFLWYALNPIILAASFLTPLFSFTMLVLFLGLSTIIAHIADQTPLIQVIQSYSDIYLVSLLTACLVMLFAGLMKEMDKKAAILRKQQRELTILNKRLTKINTRYEETLEHIMSLYYLVEIVTSNNQVKEMVEAITEALMKCTQKDAAFFYLLDVNQRIEHFVNKTDDAKLEELIREANVENIYHIRTIGTSKNSGMIGVRKDEQESFLFHRTFDFIAKLSEIVLERIQMEQMLNNLSIIEEQNRIANEIHDSVSQKLFGMVYALHSLQARGPFLEGDVLTKELEFLGKVANSSLKELRAAIYKLSTIKKGEMPFLYVLKNYVTEFERLSEVKIDFSVEGEESFISKDIRQELYRIICEACGNAVRHGKCQMIHIHLELQERLRLVIKDDGIGWTSSSTSDKGIGLYNMKSIVQKYGGTFSISGVKGEGTILQMELPNNHEVHT